MLSIFDLLIAALLAIAATYGLLRGFVRIAIGVAGLAVSLLLALRWADFGPGWFDGLLASAQASRLAAFFIVLIGGLIATAVLGWLAIKLIRAAQLGWIDRLIGAGVGLFGAALLSCAITVALTTFLPPGTRMLAESRMLPVALHLADVAAVVLPPQMAEQYRERRDALRESFEPAAEPEPV